jgi:hypothetical protein
MLALLLNMPQSQEEWARWSFHHRQSHNAIRLAIRSQLSIDLPEYIIDPISSVAPNQFLAANQHAHTDMNGALGRQGSNIQDVDMTNERALRAWIYSHWLEHNTAEDTLRIGS